ncbi:MAG: NAD(P)-dependent oxidoreductase [Pseudomonadota bacterium]|nr:NAD(P)-dependent oxidoreductase [Pseudomonadota bacterium]
MKILITGGTGYLGKIVSKCLRSKGYEVLSVGKTKNDFEGIINCDLSNPDSALIINKKIKPDLIIHLAAHIPKKTNMDATLESYKGNVLTAQTVLKISKLNKSCPILNTSSISVYGEAPFFFDGKFKEIDKVKPDSFYGRDKRTAEKIFLESDSLSLSLRLSGLHGSGRKNGVVFNFINSILFGNTISIPSPRTEIAPLWVQDAADGIMLAMDFLLSKKIPKIFNLAGSEVITLSSLAEYIMKVSKKKVAIKAGKQPAVRRILSTALIEKELNFFTTPLQKWLSKEIFEVLENRNKITLNR